ncbi:hypothetical protein AX768_11990 [Burkholderia sp. PAMC 28687]|nr:hypothetical protein AX768_11990 [Burkholderia sp. PAMC 28687]
MIFLIVIAGDLTIRGDLHNGFILSIPGAHREYMSPIEYHHAAYRLRKDLSLEILTLTALNLILSYHAMTSTKPDWMFG